MQLRGSDVEMRDDMHVMYNREINDILRSGAYMGYFQLWALASVLGSCIVSVYPPKGSPAAQRDLHRVVLPRVLRCNIPRFIMWSRITDCPDHAWNANHFVVLLPYNGEETATIKESSVMYVLNQTK